jgi:hypothetical protein
VLNLCLAACWLVLAYRTGRRYDEQVLAHRDDEEPVVKAAA